MVLTSVPSVFITASMPFLITLIVFLGHTEFYHYAMVEFQLYPVFDNILFPEICFPFASFESVLCILLGLRVTVDFSRHYCLAYSHPSMVPLLYIPKQSYIC